MCFALFLLKFLKVEVGVYNRKILMMKASLCHRLEVLENLYIFQHKLFLSSRDGLVHWNGDFARHWNQFIRWWNGITIPICLFGFNIVLDFWIGIPFPHFWPSLHVILVELDPSVDLIIKEDCTSIGSLWPCSVGLQTIHVHTYTSIVVKSSCNTGIAL